MANEAYVVGDLPSYASFFGVKTPFGISLPPGGKVAAYVRSTGPQDGDDPNILNNFVTTLSSGLARCRSGRGDKVIVLEGHSESVTDATMLTNLKADTQIIGVGTGSSQPTFRWTATGSQWPINKDNVVITGLNLKLEGANGVVKAILHTGASGLVVGNNIVVASGATAKATIAYELGTGSDGTIIAANYVHGTATHNVTDGFKVVAALDRIRFFNNVMDFSATAANGNIHVTAAATLLKIAGNMLQNSHTASTANVTIDNVAATGLIWDNYLSTINNGTVTAQGLILGAAALVRCFQNFSCDEPIKSGVLTPVAAT